MNLPGTCQFYIESLELIAVGVLMESFKLSGAILLSQLCSALLIFNYSIRSLKAGTNYIDLVHCIILNLKRVVDDQ